MPLRTLVQAINDGLRTAMRNDERVVVMGEDVGVNGGVFRATEGLQQEFGTDRVIDTPLAESGIVGTAIGMAAYGLRPVAEIQFDGFLPPAFDQIVSHAARLRWRSRGRFHVPLVIRAPYGGGIRALEHHSESPEAYYVHTPGLKVVVPSNAYDAKGLLLSSIRDPDPVIFFEPKRMYRAFRQEVPDGDYTVPLSQCAVAREGKDLTVIAWGAEVPAALEAAQNMAEKNVSVEVVDLRTLWPLDLETLLDSVRKTGRAVIVQQSPRTGGFAAELMALLHERLLLQLQGPVVRVTGYDVHMPYFTLEHAQLPTTERIARAIEQALSY